MGHYMDIPLMEILVCTSIYILCVQWPKPYLIAPFPNACDTEIIAKGSLTSTIPEPAPIALAGGEAGQFDSCGAWLSIFTKVMVGEMRE